MSNRIATFQLRDVEAELEAEQRRSRDLQAENRKLSKLLQELRQQADDDHRAATELADQVNTLQLRIKTLRRQLEEAVSACRLY
jgi:chromosome segregation ATPase